MSGDINNQDLNTLVFAEAYTTIKEKLKNGIDVIFDATNINYKRRIETIKTLKSKGDIECVAVFVATPYEECLKRNSKRDRVVPQHVIERMYRNFFVPQKYEGWDTIEVILSKEEVDLRQYVEDNNFDMEQNNPFHTLTVSAHCTKCAKILLEKETTGCLPLAAALHDIGKPFTKTFKDKKGEITEVAHYYDHPNVGAYLSFIFTRPLKTEQKLEIAKLIQWHMLFHNNMLPKTLKKYTDLLGEETIEQLKIINEADIAAQ